MITTDSDEQRLNILSRVTVEHILYALVGILAAILRLPGLGAPPLSPTEATEALAIWDQWQPASELLKIGSPLYFSLTGFVSQFLGFSDETMRLAPALFGIGLVILPWFLRHRIGKLGALIASLLMTISPTLTFASRTAGGESAAIFFGLLVFIAWFRYQESAEVKWFYTLIIAIALGLATAPIFYGFLFSLLLAWLAQAIFGPALFLDENGYRRRITLPTGTETQNAALIAIGIFILMATSFLLRTDGIGAVGDIGAQWLARFTVQAEPEFWISTFLAILRYELVLIIIGLPALIWVIRSNSDQPYPFFLAYWFVASLLFLLLQRGVMGNVGLVTIPGLLLIGTFSDAVIGEIRDWRRLSFSMVILIAGGIIYVNLSRYGRLLDANQTVSASYNILLVVITLMATVTLFTILWGWDKETVKKGVLAGFLLIIVMVSWSIAWWIGRAGANDTRELLVRSASDDDLLLLASTIRELSWRLDNSERGVQILSTIESPALRWYLRDFTNLEMGNALPHSMDAPLIITTNEQVPELANSYIGSDFGFTRLNSPQNISTADLLRWWLFHESDFPMPEERLILWLRADLAGSVS